MSNEATATDQKVRMLLQRLNIQFYEQGSNNIEINKGLAHASKQGTNKVGKPEFTFVSNGYPVIIEDKPTLEKARLVDNNNQLIFTYEATVEFADNGAVWYAQHIVKDSTFHEAFAIGASGSSSLIYIQPYYVYLDNEGIVKYKKLPTITDFSDFTDENIYEYYRVNVKGEKTKEQLEIEDLQKTASQLHEDMRNYASLEGENKATVISGILLALEQDRDIVNRMMGSQDLENKDGDIIYTAIKAKLNSNSISPKDKKSTWIQKISIILNKFNFIKTNIMLNEINDSLGMTPLKYFTQTLMDKVISHFKNNTDFDILGDFYGEFVKYGGSDGNSLGIVLTPHHITSLMTELIDIKSNDYVLDPACGSAGFLISAMDKMLSNVNSEKEKSDIKQNHLYGIELQEKLFTVATTNMILRGDGKSNLQLANMFNVDSEEMKKHKINKILFNPPYSQAKNKATRNLSELNFIKKALSMMRPEGKLAVIVPQSTMIGKTKDDKTIKKELLKGNTLEAVITMNPNTFYGIGVNPVIAIFTAGVPHENNKLVSFVDFRDDGYKVNKHLGLLPDGSEKIKREELVQYLKHNLDLSSHSNLKALRSTITAEDEWLYSFYYFDDSIPEPELFTKTVQDYLSFKFDQTIHGRGYLFNEDDSSKK
ncbi:adenine methyltransferase [Bombilactobacillus bombi]|uniref:site-specific DNA-methyltransferase (adenine-specific) n=1 Tax=Bombilactobacillus bombi TaxID=1303590 RepID=A0A3R6V6I3_9LACO|nr:N-6 DNA methylase [Bombilactobacillus bombi]RHW46825.1 adenine methyltransferase [Bombilactobacillus bombi]